MKKYSEKLLDPRWQRKRLEIFQRDDFSCVFCGSGERTLHVHHLEYCGDPWDVPDKSLITLCESCHHDEHGMRAQAEGDLITQLRKSRFSAADILQLAVSVQLMKLDARDAATAITYQLVLPGEFKEIIKEIKNRESE